MTTTPPWLPPIISVDGEYHAVVRRLYEIFNRDFNLGRPRLGTLQVWWNRRTPPGDQYEEGFWHLITRKDKKTGERLHDPRRAERLPWCAPTICHHTDPAVKMWDYREANGKARTYVWLEHFDYVILFDNRKVRERKTGREMKIAFLLTAYHLDGPWMRRSFRRKYEKRIT